MLHGCRLSPNGQNCQFGTDVRAIIDSLKISTINFYTNKKFQINFIMSIALFLIAQLKQYIFI